MITAVEFEGLLTRVARCLATVERLLDAVGAPAVRAASRELVDTVRALLPYPGAPWTLWSHGNDWSGPSIGGLISRQVGRASPGETQIDDHWSGPAAQAYLDTLGPQQEALVALVALAHTLDEALTTIALAVVGFWVSVLALLTGLVAELIGEVTVSLAGAAPVGATLMGVSIAKALALLSGVLGGSWAVLGGEALVALKKLHRAAHDSSAFPDGHWPRIGGRYGDSAAWHR